MAGRSTYWRCKYSFKAIKTSMNFNNNYRFNNVLWLSSRNWFTINLTSFSVKRIAVAASFYARIKIPPIITNQPIGKWSECSRSMSWWHRYYFVCYGICLLCRFTPCQEIPSDGLTIPDEHLRITCTVRGTSSKHVDHHYFYAKPTNLTHKSIITRMKEQFWSAPSTTRQEKSIPSVLIIGISHMSRNSMIRTMPKLADCSYRKILSSSKATPR